MATTVLRRETFAAGSALFSAGDAPRCAYLIQSGEVEVVGKRGGADVVLTRLAAGDLVGEMALIDQSPRSATALARIATTCVVITALDLQQRLEAADPLLRALLKAVTGKLRKASVT